MNLVRSETFFVLFALLSAGGYVFGSWVLYRIGRRFGVGSFGDYLIPVYNLVLLCRCAEISPLLLFLLLVPPVNLGFSVHLWGTLARKLGHGYWMFGLGMLLLPIPALILAFENPVPAGAKGMTTVWKPSIHCISGEFSGSRLSVETEGLIIGRSAERSNLVLSSPEVSAIHTRVWSDAEGRVWVEDMRSSNGTYYCQPRPGEAAEWIEVNGPVALVSGSHVRLGDNAVEFVVS